MIRNALLIDVSSIQKYVFGSSRLKENLGASYLISHLFTNTIQEISVQPIKAENKNEYEGYIGGGNALLFFNSRNDAEKFLEKWTLNLLVHTPGITISSAIGELDLDDFQVSRDKLFKQLRENKSKYIPQTITQRHGFSAECQSDGYSMDVWNNSEEQFLSSATNAKISAFSASKKKTAEMFESALGSKYCFTDLLDELGQSRGSENHIAIVHIDGNSMGDRFKACESLAETKQLSGDVEKAVEESFNVLLGKIVSDIESGILKDYMNIKCTEGSPTKVPIRPIILGGDDITFVCDGRMGIYYAKIFMEEFAKQPVSFGEPLSSCAGIAVIKTKYPFYKGYQLAEELCASAKSRRREKNDNGSWLDFHIAYGGFSGDLNEIRENNFKVSMGSLIYRPYKIIDDSEFSFDSFVQNAGHIKNKWPNNKIKTLREVLTLGEDAIHTFYNEMIAQKLSLPDIDSKNYNANLFANGVTPYFDIIELLEYYPKYELVGGGNEKN